MPDQSTCTSPPPAFCPLLAHSYHDLLIMCASALLGALSLSPLVQIPCKIQNTECKYIYSGWQASQHTIYLSIYRSDGSFPQGTVLKGVATIRGPPVLPGPALPPSLIHTSLPSLPYALHFILSFNHWFTSRTQSLYLTHTYTLCELSICLNHLNALCFTLLITPVNSNCTIPHTPPLIHTFICFLHSILSDHKVLSGKLISTALL